MSKQKDKKIVFSEEIDSSINGIALGTAFVMLSIIVVYFEIFVELDYSNQKKLIKLIKALKEKYHKTVIIASNNANILYEITDDIVILKKGRILAADNTIKVYQNTNLLKENEVDVPDLIKFTMLAKEKKVKLSYHRDIRDLIKDVYKHV